MQKITIYDANTSCVIEIAYKKEPELWVEQQAMEARWGLPDEFYYEITELDPETESHGIVIGDTMPENPKNGMLWLHKATGNMYSWKQSSNKWLSVDRAVFPPKENLHSEWEE